MAKKLVGTLSISGMPLGEGEGAADAVLFTPQRLNAEQRAQARTNIGAVSAAEVDEALEQIDLTGYATEQYVQEEIGKIPEVDLSNYYTKEEVDEAIAGVEIDDDVIQEQIDANRDWGNATLLSILSPGIKILGGASSTTVENFFENIRKYGSTDWYINTANNKPTLQQLYSEGFRALLICSGEGKIEVDKYLNNSIDLTKVWSTPTVGKRIYQWGTNLIFEKDNNSFRKALAKIYYNNTTSGLTATNIPAAIDELAAKIASGGGGTTDLSNYYTKAEVDEQLEPYALKTEIPDVSNFTTMAAVEEKGYQTEAQVNTLIDTALGVIENGSY